MQYRRRTWTLLSCALFLAGGLVGSHQPSVAEQVAHTAPAKVSTRAVAASPWRSAETTSASPAAVRPADPAETRSLLGAAGKPVIDTATGPVVADELLVRFDDAITDAEAAELIEAAGGELVYAGASGVYLAQFADFETSENARGPLGSDRRVREVVRNHITRGTGIGTSPSFSLVSLQWNLWAMGLHPYVWRPSAPGVTVAILDTGAAYEDFSDGSGDYVRAPDMATTTFANGHDFINGDTHPNDDQGHGTHVAGLIAADGGIASIAPGATIMPVKVLDAASSGTELALAEGLVFAADAGADVINMSLSFSAGYFPSQLLQSAVNHAASRGAVMVAAAGNDGSQLVAYPAAFRDVIAVGASQLTDDYRPWWWAWVQRWPAAWAFLDPASYTNSSYAVDVPGPRRQHRGRP